MMDINKFIAPPRQFEVLEHDRVIAKVKLDYRNQTVEVWQDDTVEPVLQEYVPTDIVKQTHGVLYDDYVWIRFSGEELKCADVHPRYASEQGVSSNLYQQQ